jgi:hypothetical protein
VAAKPKDVDRDILVDLSRHATLLLERFLSTGLGSRAQAQELVAELETVVAEFRRRVPPNLFLRTEAAHDSVPAKCSICLESTSRDQIVYRQGILVYHEGCLPPCRLCGKPVNAWNCIRVMRSSSDDRWEARHALCPLDGKQG